jgi:hypothetical protein
MSEGVIIKPWTAPPDESVIRLLESILEDARKVGGPVTALVVTVSGAGLVQTAARGHQIRELIRGVDQARSRLSADYDRAITEALANPQMPLRPHKN